MRSTEEIVRDVHVRARALQREEAQRRLTITGGACGALIVALLAVIGVYGGLWHRPLTASYAGASLLGDSAGGYVLVAVVAFMLGVTITVILKWQQRKKETDEQGTPHVQNSKGGFLDDDALAPEYGFTPRRNDDHA